MLIAQGNVTGHVLGPNVNTAKAVLRQVAFSAKGSVTSWPTVEEGYFIPRAATPWNVQYVMHPTSQIRREALTTRTPMPTGPTSIVTTVSGFTPYVAAISGTPVRLALPSSPAISLVTPHTKSTHLIFLR